MRITYKNYTAPDKSSGDVKLHQAAPKRTRTYKIDPPTPPQDEAPAAPAGKAKQKPTRRSCRGRRVTCDDADSNVPTRGRQLLMPGSTTQTFNTASSPHREARRKAQLDDELAAMLGDANCTTAAAEASPSVSPAGQWLSGGAPDSEEEFAWWSSGAHNRLAALNNEQPVQDPAGQRQAPYPVTPPPTIAPVEQAESLRNTIQMGAYDRPIDTVSRVCRGKQPRADLRPVVAGQLEGMFGRDHPRWRMYAVLRQLLHEERQEKRRRPRKEEDWKAGVVWEQVLARGEPWQVRDEKKVEERRCKAKAARKGKGKARGRAKSEVKVESGRGR